MKALQSKLVLSILGFAMALSSFSASAIAAQIDPVQYRWAEIRSLALKCAVQPYSYKDNGSVSLGRIRSVCRELQITESEATFQLSNTTVRIALRDSAQSDEGDLNTVLFIDENGRESIIGDDVPAFGDVLYAILGQDAEGLPRVLE